MKKIYSLKKTLLFIAFALSFTNAFSQATVTPSGNVYVCDPPASIVITANATNAVTFLWSNGSTDQSITVTATGQYYCTVSDNIGGIFNSDTANVTIVSLSFNLIGINNVDCNGNANGSIEVVATGGTGSYSYELLGNPPAQPSGLFTGLSGALYNIRVTDLVAGCSYTQSFNVTEPQNLILPYVSTDVFCNGYAAGSIDLQPSGGTQPYSYQWSNGSTDEDQLNLVAGLYIVTVTDANGCSDINAVEINETSQLIIGQSSTNISCSGGGDGTAYVDVSGGVAPYTYSWSTNPVQTSALALGLPAGFVSVTITDAVGCDSTVSFLITSPNALDALVSATDITCFGYDNGTITVSPFGGTPYQSGSPYNVSWNTIPVQTGNTATNLEAGTFVATITDSTGCLKYVVVTINEPDPIDIVISTVDPLCAGSSTGQASAVAVGGTGPYSYSWNTIPVQSTSIATGLSAGLYFVTVTDVNGCTSSQNVNIVDPSAISVSSTIDNVNCNGGNNGKITLTTSGGNGGYNYLWNTNPAQTNSTATGLIVGSYSVIITDASGCSKTFNFVITQPTPITCNISATNASCFGLGNGTATVNPSGGVSPYSVIWSNGSSNNTITGLLAGTYTATITDANGCMKICDIIVGQSSSINISTTVSNVTCFGSSNGSVVANVTGGNAPYTYLWSNGSTNNIVSNLNAGVYTVSVTDNNGCSSSVSVSISQPAALGCICNANAQNVSCFGGTNGSISALPVGGTAPYSFLWSNGQSTQAISGLTAGSYTVTITDANGCTIVGIVQLTQPSQLLAAITCVNNVTCNGNNNGSACVTGFGGTPPYTYSWNTVPVQTNFSATGLFAGTYIATITDSKGCTATASVSIAQPTTGLSCSISKTDVSCFGQSNGTATVSVIGGSAPYTFQWNTVPFKTTQTVLGLSAGTYTCVVTDANNCSSTCSVTILQPTQLVALYQSTNVSCASGTNGAIDVTVTGGTQPYSYNWSNGATTQDLNGIPAGAYVVQITDNKGCAFSALIIITQPLALKVFTASTNATCYGASNGTGSVTTTGGVAPMSYLWSNGETAPVVTDFAAGTYTVTVTDANGCTKTGSVTIGQPAPFTCSTYIIDPVLCNGNNGKAGVNVTGGVPGYTYSWSTSPVQVTQIATGLSPGTYFVIVTDNQGCTTSCSVSLVGNTALSCNATNTNVSCNGGSDGTASVVASGGTAPYSYLWNTGVASTNSSISGLSAGIYTVTVTDNSGCTTVCAVLVTEPTALSLLVNATGVSCNGGNNGSATANVSGGTAPYSYTWSDGQSTQTANGLNAGIYNVTVTDDNGCTITSSVQITEATPIICSTTGNDALCAGSSTGSASVSASGGTGTLSYLWNTAPPQTAATATGLSAGIYTVVVYDANNCSSSCTVSISEPSALNCSTSVLNDVTCYGGSDGAASVSASGGTGSYSFVWSTTPIQTTANATGLGAGSYSVVVSDANGCTTICGITISQPTQVLCNTNVVNTICGLDNGSATVSATGGNPGYTYLWSDGQTGQTANGLAFGTYTVTATDASGCTSTCNAAIGASSGVIFSTSKTNASCNGVCDGTAQVLTISGGTAPYTFLWSTGATTQSVSNLCSGNVTVTVTDANSCAFEKTIFIGQPNALILGSANFQDVSCNGGSNGKVKVTVAGGAVPYSYLWSNGKTTALITGLTAGTYTATVTDSYGCSKTASFNISEPSAIVLNSTQTNVSCFGGSNGTATVIASGGTPGYTYSWSTLPVQTNITATGLSSGSYIATVTDANACTKTITVNISQPLQLSCNTGVSNPLCFGSADGSANVFVSGGTAPYSYQWSNGSTNALNTGLTAGTYTVTVTDQNGCTSSCSAVLTDPLQLTCDINGTNATCVGLSNGSATVTPSGGTSPYTFLWSNGSTDQTITGLSAGTYYATVTDNNGCTSICSVIISEPQLINISFSNIISATCGNSNASAIAVANGGTSPYSYIWSNSQGGSILSNVIAGTYTVTVTDNNGCSASSSLTISGTAELDLTVNGSNPTCFGNSNGSASVSVTGGNGIYGYSWSSSPIQTTATATGLASGTYQVLVSDEQGCSATATVVLSTPDPLSCSTTSTSAICGSTNGTAAVTVSGGTLPYAYSWSNGSTSASITGVIAGTYTVIITDGQACTTSCEAVVIGGPAITFIKFSKSVVSCFGGSDGQACVTQITGGVAPYSYQWSNGSTISCIVNVAAGPYTVTVTDAFGCSLTKVVTVTQNPNITVSFIKNNATCGACNGTLNAAPTGGVPGYTYIWSTSPVQTTKKATGLCAGVYTVIVTDKRGCTKTASATVLDINKLVLATSSTNVTGCNGNNNGTATASPSIGTPPYNYLWSNGSTTATITGLFAGPYSVIVTDVAGCSRIGNVIITEPAPTIITLDSVADLVCFGDNDGILYTSSSGGTSPYTYLWNTIPPQTTANATGLAAGSYTITVTDASGCTNSSSFTITSPDKLICNAIVVTDVTCFGGNDGSASASASGSTGPYAYLWNNGSTGANLSNVLAGTYTVTVTSSVGCISSCSVTIIEPPQLLASCSTTDVSSYNNNDGSATVNASGGSLSFNLLATYSYVWSNGSTDQTINNLTAGTYNVTVTDANGCTTSATAIINQPAFLCNTFMSADAKTYYNPPLVPAGSDTLKNYLLANFSNVYPSGLVIQGSCPGAKSITFTSAAAVIAYLPAKNKVAAITQNYIDPDTSLQNSLAAQLTALRLTIDFDLYDPNFAPGSTVNFRDLLVDSGSLTGITVQQLYDEAANALTGCGSLLASNGVLRTYCAEVNSSWNLGTKKNNTVTCPPSPLKPADNGFMQADKIRFTQYPNPTDGLFKISFESENSERFTFELLDLAGRQLDKQFRISYEGLNEHSFNYNSIPKGIYMIKFTMGENVRIKRVVIQ